MKYREKNQLFFLFVKNHGITTLSHICSVTGFDWGAQTCSLYNGFSSLIGLPLLSISFFDNLAKVQDA